MNRIHQIIILLFSLSICQLYPKELDSLNYFPHTVGNVWQYMYDDGRLFQEKIFKDTVDNFGNIFLDYGASLPEYRWIYRINTRQDSVFENPNSIYYLKLKYKFPLDSGEIFERDTGLYAKVNDTYEVIIFGNFTKAITISYYGGHPDSFGTGWEYTEVLANNIGKIWYGNEVEYMNLIGCVIDGDTSGIIFTAVEDQNPPLQPSSVELYQNYPNPFNSTTTISYELSRRENVELVVYDILGKEIKILVKGEFPKGNYKVSFDSEALPSGIYIYTLRVNDFTASKKMTLLK